MLHNNKKVYICNNVARINLFAVMSTFSLPKQLLITSALLVAVSACNRDNEVTPDTKEAVFTRLLVSDADGTTVSLIDPRAGSSESFQAKFAGSSLYATQSGRFAAVVNNANHYVQFFDSGIEHHNDHADVVGKPKWAPLVSERNKPAHLYFWEQQGYHAAIFNDGEGSLTLTNDYEIGTAAKPKTVMVDVPHHGAMAAFNNGTIAVTQKDGTISGTLPERVKIIDQNGTVLKASTIATKGIHGEAGNGEIVLFGHPEGILVVGKDGSQRNITYPAGVGRNWLSTIYHDSKSDAFYGYSAKGGVYRIDVINNQISPLLTSDQIALFRVDNEGREAFALLMDGTLRVFDGKTGTAGASAKVAAIIDPAAKVKPDMVVSKKFVYITQPDQREVLVIQREGLSVKAPLKLTTRPAKLALFGAQVDASGH